MFGFESLKQFRNTTLRLDLQNILQSSYDKIYRRIIVGQC